MALEAKATACVTAGESAKDIFKTVRSLRPV
jgi:hypothetical protein